MASPLVKVCGITDPGQAADAARCGADLIGVVLAPSPRRVTMEAAVRILAAVPKGTRTVAVLVDPGEDLLGEVASRLRPDFVQLHGDETPETCRRSPIPVIKAFIVGAAFDPAEVSPYLGVVTWFLFDSGRGSGYPLPLGGLAALPLPRPFFLAGGLIPGNVAAAVATLAPDGIDCSSGVESAPGVKDPELIRRLVAAAKGGVS
jgi:phosphoribosylanthranilate isomerase